MKDYYKILGINKSATGSEITAAYRKLVQRYHPDKNNSPQSTVVFMDITEAYKTLSDPKLREYYDFELLESDFKTKTEKRNLSQFRYIFCCKCYSKLRLNLAERRGEVPVNCTACGYSCSMIDAEAIMNNIFRYEIGECPSCNTKIRFPMEARINQKKKIKCPGCLDNFYIDEAESYEGFTDLRNMHKKKSVEITFKSEFIRLIGAIARVVVITTIVMIVLSIFFES